uniref:NAD(P)(+)--arginine ADP-ribosyltransferase n=1 Tax=Fundulus heteroclitus TaxID=8078 RepID=A0A3Q2PJH7_FUNHE
MVTYLPCANSSINAGYCKKLTNNTTQLVLKTNVLFFFVFQESNEITLEFYNDSVDDMYSNCKANMETMMFDKYSEELTEKPYGKYWEEEKQNIINDKILTKMELLAIRVYTENKNNVYSEFNRAVRTGRKIYGTSFEFHNLHFFLTSALQKLKETHKGSCYNTYRRSKDTYKLMPNEIRFGSFASSSLTTNQISYGQETCFKIETCHGAVVEQYSAYPAEREVLIPPYEKFTKVAELRDCFPWDLRLVTGWPWNKVGSDSGESLLGPFEHKSLFLTEATRF